MTIHFSRDELLERRARTLAAMAERELDCVLLFKQETGRRKLST